MIVDFGKYKGLELRRLLLDHPDYVNWLLSLDPASGTAAKVRPYLMRHIKRFDEVPFKVSCMGHDTGGARCGGRVVRATAYYSSGGLSVEQLHWWCATCDSYQLGAIARLPEARTYEQTLGLVESYGGSARDYKSIVRQFVQAKGAPQRVSEKALTALFGPSC